MLLGHLGSLDWTLCWHHMYMAMGNVHGMATNWRELKIMLVRQQWMKNESVLNFEGSHMTVDLRHIAELNFLARKWSHWMWRSHRVSCRDQLCLPMVQIHPKLSFSWQQGSPNRSVRFYSGSRLFINENLLRMGPKHFRKVLLLV